MQCIEINDESFRIEFTITMVEIHLLWISQSFIPEKAKCGHKNYMFKKLFAAKAVPSITPLFTF